MRHLALALLTATGLALAFSASALAQTYDPDYPVCLQAYGPNANFIECAYTSLAQCNMSASGRSAQCYPNPYFAYEGTPRPGRGHRRYYR